MEIELVRPNQLYYELTNQILGCCFDVVNELGAGFLENVYQSSLIIALSEKGIRADREVGLEVNFRGQVVGKFYADIVVENVIIVELKALKNLEPMHNAQLINYLKATKMKVGLLVNFGRQVLEYRRLYG